MSYTAILLNDSSRAAILAAAMVRGLLPSGQTANVKAHHVTLRMGVYARDYNIGEFRKLTVTHYGEIAGRVAAFRVSGADDSVNTFPHVTIATFGDAKPKESNSITEWKEIAPFAIYGTVAICD